MRALLLLCVPAHSAALSLLHTTRRHAQPAAPLLRAWAPRLHAPQLAMEDNEQSNVVDISSLLGTAAAIGAITGLVVGIFKSSIAAVAAVAYNGDAVVMPWFEREGLGTAAILIPACGGLVVAALRYVSPRQQLGPGLAEHLAEVERCAVHRVPKLAAARTLPTPACPATHALRGIRYLGCAQVGADQSGGFSHPWRRCGCDARHWQCSGSGGAVGGTRHRDLSRVRRATRLHRTRAMTARLALSPPAASHCHCRKECV